MGLFGLDADKIIDEKALVVALFEHLKAQPLVIDFSANKSTTTVEKQGSVVTALAGLTVTIGLKD